MPELVFSLMPSLLEAAYLPQKKVLMYQHRLFKCIDSAGLVKSPFISKFKEEILFM